MKQSSTPDSSQRVESKQRKNTHGVPCARCNNTFFKVDLFLAHSCIAGVSRDRVA